MYRLSDELAKLLISMIKSPELESSGNTAFLPKSLNSIGIIDNLVAVGTDYFYTIECPTNVIYPTLPSPLVNIRGYFLYKKEELKVIQESWFVPRIFLDPSCIDTEEQVDVSGCAIQVASDVDKLTATTISTLEKLIEKEPLIIDSLNLDYKGGR